METTTKIETGKGQNDPLGKISNTISQINDTHEGYVVDFIKETKKKDLKKRDTNYKEKQPNYYLIQGFLDAFGVLHKKIK